MAAFLAAVMFVTSVPVSAIAEDVAEPEIPAVTAQPQSQPAAEPEAKTEPAPEPAAEPEKQEPAPEPEAEPEKQEPVTGQNAGSQEKMAAEPDRSVAPVNEVNQETLVLADPVVSMPGSVQAGMEITLTWEPVENAEEYVVMLYFGDGTYIGDIYYGTETTATISRQLEAGAYMVTVLSRAEGWDNGGSNVFFAVTGELPAAPMLSLDAAAYTVGGKIAYTIIAEGAEAVRLRYYGTTEDGYNSEDTYEFAADGTTTVYEKEFYTPGSFNAACCAKIDGIWSAWCDPVPFEVRYLGELGTPVLSMKDSYVAGEEITISWSALENAEEYSVHLQDSDGNYIDSWQTESETSVVTDAVLESGTYSVQIYARADGWKSHEKVTHTFTITGTLAEGPAFTADKVTVVTGNQVTFTVSREGAEKFRMQYGHYTAEYAAENGTATITQTFYGAGETVEVRFSACVDGVWTAYGPAQEIIVEDLPTLDSTYPVLPETIRAGEDIEITWEPVEHAENYWVYVGKLVDGDHYEQEWSDYLNAATEECRTMIPAGDLKQGSYLVTVMARASGYHDGNSYGAEMEVGAPLPENAFDYYSYDGTEAQIYEYLGDPVPEELTIPATIHGASVVSIFGPLFENGCSRLKISIPASVTYIADYAFDGCTGLTIRGYYGSVAEEYAILNGYAFEALDASQPAVSASWEEPVLVNREMTFTIDAPGATEVVMYEDGNKEYYATVLITNSGASVLWTPEEIGTYCVRFEAKVNEEWLSTKNYELEVTSGGRMPQVKNLTASAEVIEPGTAVTITWDAPDGITAPEYGVYVAGPGESAEDISYWYDVTAGESSYTFRDSWFDQEGIYTLAVRVEPDPGYDPSITTCTVEVKSTKIWDFIPSTGELVAYHGSDKEIVIPAEIDGKPVRTIGESIFAGSDITSVVIPEGIRTISYWAFQNCASLTAVSLPSTLRYIYMRAFEGCTALTQISLPEGLYSLGSYAFTGCEALTSVTIPAGITELDSGVFSWCDALSTVTLPDGLTTIKSDAFGYCDSLRSIIIPQSVTTINQYAFRNNDALTVCGYLGSAAETFAEKRGYDFVALDSIQTGDISFTLERDTLYYGGLMKVTVTAPDAEKLRLHLDGQVSECSISDGKAEISRYIHGLGEHTVTVSQCVEGKWMAPCEAVTFTVIEMGTPVIEPIPETSAQQPVTIRWKPVEGAVSYSVYLTKDDAYLADFQDVQSLDKDGYVYQQLEGSLLSHEGIYNVQVTARAADSGSTHASRTFEVSAALEFLYEVNADGTATLTGHAGSVQDVVVPAQLDGHTVVQIAEKAFLNSQAVSITLPATVTMVNTNAFYGCEALETVRISDAAATLRPYFFAECSKLVSIYAGAGIFAEESAFGNARTDTVVYGWSGGQLEEEVLTACKFSSLGELAAGPVAAAEDIWQNEELTYTITCEGASRLHVQVIYPDGSVDSLTGGTGSFTEVADGYNFNNITEDCLVRIRAAALVNGAWTAYGEKEVTVSVLGVLAAPVFEQIGRLERHLDHAIRWYPVEDAQNYDVTIVEQQDDIPDRDKTLDASVTQIEVEAGSLRAGNYTITVKASAEGYEDAQASADFEIYEMKLDTPVLSVDERIARHLGTTIRWEDVPVAEYYTVTVQREDGTATVYKNKKVEGTETKLLPSQLTPGMYTVSVAAHAQYCTDSDAAMATFEIYEEQLGMPEVTAPETVVGDVEFDVAWKSVEGAEKYHLEIMDQNGYRLLSITLGSQTLTHTVCLDAYQPEGKLTLRVIASADYRVDGVAELGMSYKPLYSYQLVKGSAVITGYNGPDTKLRIPAWINGYEVTAIGDGAFENMDALVEVYLPDSVISIGARSFRNCTSLQHIEGDGVTEIGEEAFYNCIALRDFSFGKQKEYQVKVMNNAFYNVPALESTDDREGLMDITVSQNSGGEGSEGGEGGEGSEEIPSFAGNLYLGSVTYEEGITRIPAGNHYGNLLLASVYLPRSLRSIESEAFAACPSLTDMRVYDGIEFIAEDAFSGADNLTLRIYTSDLEKKSYVEQYALLHGIPYEKYYSAERDERLYGIEYLEGTYRIGARECYEESRLENVWLPESLESIGSKAFARCGALMNVYLYDGITSIDDDAFEGSSNVRFLIYTDDVNKVSYVEEYAKEHGIPYDKIQLSAKPEKQVDTGNPTPATVRIDEPVDILVSGIPADADRVALYADGVQIESMAAGGVTIKSCTYTFRTFGQQILTAEAYVNGEVVKLSWEKPVNVTGIRVTADRESAWTGETVNFTVEAYPETAEVQFYAEDLLFGTVPLTQSESTFAYAFTEAGDRKITVRSASGLKSRTLTLTISCIGQLEQPVLEAEELQYAGDGLVCSWNTTENTDGYVLRVRYANGRDILQRRIEDDGTDRMHCTISAEELGGAGVYELYLMNYGYQYNQGESEVITVELTEDTTPVFTMDKQSVMTGEPVNFTFRAFGATQVELWADGQAIETVPLTNGRGTFTRPFTQSGQREIAIRALGENGWTELSEVQILTVTSLGALDAVQVTAEPVQMLGNSLKASWAPVEHADGYTVYFRNEAHETIWKLDTQDCAVSVPADQIQTSGNYYIMVVAHGAGYDQSQGSVNVTVMDRLPGPVILAPGENEVCTNTTVKLTWQAVTGAESYVVSLARKTDRVDAAGQPIFEKVWAAPNETVNVGTDLSYDLTGLIYGGEYRVAVGTVSTLDSGEQCIGWTERQFSVQMPELSVTLAANTLTPSEGGQVILTAVANHPMTQAVLTDETGAVVETVSSNSEVVNGTRVFTFVVAVTELGEKTYTVTVSGTDEMEGQTALPASVTVIVQAKGKLPAPNVKNLSNGDIVPSENYVVTWDPVVLGEDMTFGGYSVSVYYLVQAGVPGETFDDWDPLPGCDNMFVGDQCSYTLPAMDPTKLYRIEIYTVPEGTETPSLSISGCTAINFNYRTVPAFSLTAVETTQISKQPVTVRWNAPVWPLDPSMKPSSYVIHWYRGSENVYSHEIGGDKLEATLPGEYVLDGTYTVDVYAMLDDQQQKADGDNGFEIKPAQVTIDKYGDGAAPLTAFPGEPITITGTATGGITKVLAILIPAGGKPEDAYALKAADETEVKSIVVDVVNGTYTVKLDPVKDLEISEGDKTNHAIEVYGFSDGIDTVIGQHAASTWAMVDVDGGAIFSITSNNVSPNNWVFIGENAHIDVTTNKAVKEIKLSNGTTPLGLAIDKVDKYADRNEFGADFQSSVEGLHVITAADANTQSDAEPKSVNVYVVTPKPETEVRCKPDVTATGWIIPKEGYTEGATVTITENTKLTQRGVCGDFVLVKVNDGASFFVHKKYLDTPFIITFPDDGFELDLSANQLVELRWTTHPEATSYKMSIDVEIINEQGKKETVTFEKPDIAAQSGEYQWTTFNTFEIYAMVRRRCNFYTSSNWPITIRIGAYA